MDRIQFTVNGVKCNVGNDVSSDVMLLDYLRKNLELRGTKYMCREGGCGACIVSAVKKSGENPVAVNSCLVSVTSCQDWDITTIEKVGNRLDGYDPVQKMLAYCNGTQCGYCTPGWVNLMHTLVKSKQAELTKLDIEKYMSSNICRCTGYRSILDAFKTFATDASGSELADIEELDNICKKTGQLCKPGKCSDQEWCFINKGLLEDQIEVKLKDGKLWYKVNQLAQVFQILDKRDGKSYMLVNGNTAKGVFPIDEYPDILIDISTVSELRQHLFDQNLEVGAGFTLNETIDLFKECSKTEYFEYLSQMSDHIFLIANTSVRNSATLGGNMMTKYTHREFPSDIFLLFETVGATVNIIDKSSNVVEIVPVDFLNTPMDDKVVMSYSFPPLMSAYKFVSFKVMPRAQNAEARVNAGFLYKLDTDNIVESVRVVFGGISPKFVHATKTEDYLKGKKLFTNETLQGALNILKDELVVEGYPEEESKAKKKLALGLFYKGLLKLCPEDQVGARYRSGSTNYSDTRPVSSGRQVYDTNDAMWPVSEPIPKIEALIQCAGEAPYTDDIPTQPREVFASFVLSTIPKGEIDRIDPSAALKLEGVVAFYTAEDIPGKNSFIPRDYLFNLADEVVLSDGKIEFNGQPIGIIVAETEHLSEIAAKLVVVEYKNVKKPVLKIAEAVKDLTRVLLVATLPATDHGIDVAKVIKGKNEIYSQYHLHMEKQTCVTIPTDDGLEINSSTQWIDAVQIAVAKALNIKQNSINMRVRRCGGGFGAKISRSTQIAVACSLVAHKLNRPCRMILPLITNMKAIGKRFPSTSEFKVLVNKNGVIQSLVYNLFEDNGYMINEPFVLYALPSLKNSYDRSRWIFKGFDVVTDTAKNSWTRSPGTLEMIAMIEYIMEQICYELSLDPINVRILNLGVTKEDEATKEIIATLKKEANYDERLAEVQKFNQENRWKKRGLRFTCIKWPEPTHGYYNISLSVNHGDGTVIITHGGIEIGQGINTKVVQVCAYCLNIPMDRIKVKATNNVTNPNGMTTGGSCTSDAVCFGVTKCCQLLLDRLAPLRLVTDTQWDSLIKEAHKRNYDLFTSYTVTPNDEKHYNVFGACLTEAEVDILTGEIQIRRVDLIEDVGQSLSPEVDVGQIEGAFIMGLGYWTCEHLMYDPKSGELLSNRTWNYHVPLARDIPVDFRVYFRRNTYNDVGVLGSKATGEPAICLSICVAFAIRAALAASRLDSGIPTTEWFHVDGPYTIDKILLAANVDLKDFKLY